MSIPGLYKSLKKALINLRVDWIIMTELKLQDSSLNIYKKTVKTWQLLETPSKHLRKRGYCIVRRKMEVMFRMMGYFNKIAYNNNRLVVKWIIWLVIKLLAVCNTILMVILCLVKELNQKMDIHCMMNQIRDKGINDDN